MTTLFSSITYCDILFEQAVGAQQLRDVVNALGLRVAMLLALGFPLLFLLVAKRRIEIDLGELADQIRKHERVRIVRIQEAAALFREIGFVRFFVDGEEKLFLQREELFLARVLVKLTARLYRWRLRLSGSSIMRRSCLLRGCPSFTLNMSRPPASIFAACSNAPSLRSPGGCKACSACAPAARPAASTCRIDGSKQSPAR